MRYAPLIAVVLAASCSGGSVAPTPATPLPSVAPIRVGTGPESESTLVAHGLVALMADRGISAQVTSYDSAGDARQALELGRLDVLPSYTAAVWLDELGLSDPPAEPGASYQQVAFADQRDHQLVWLNPTRANARFAFVMAGVPSPYAWVARTAQLAALLGAQPPPPPLCVDQDFAERPDGLPAVQEAYARPDVAVQFAPPEDAVRFTAEGRCVAGLTTATDGRAWAAGLRPLDDELRVFPAFVLGVVVTGELAEERPEVVAALAPFGNRITTERMGRWNARMVPVSGVVRTVEEVAAQFAADLLDDRDPAPAATVTPS